MQIRDQLIKHRSIRNTMTIFYVKKPLTCKDTFTKTGTGKLGWLLGKGTTLS